MITTESIRKMPPGKVAKDSKVIGLELYKGKTRNTWRLYYRTRDKRERRLKLGYYPTISIADARDVARELLVDVARGNDPADRRDSVKLEYVYEQFIRAMAGKRKQTTVRMYEGLWRVHVSPAMGQKPAQSIKRAEVAKLHRKIGGHQGNRMLAFMSRLYNWCQQNDLLDPGTNPASGIEYHKEEARERVATEDELKALGLTVEKWLKSDLQGERQFARLLYALILTGARLNEWNKARREWVDFDRQVLALPDSKTGRVNINIPDCLIQTIKDAMNDSRCEYVFGVSAAKNWIKFKDQAGLGDLRMHDLRRTYATYGFNDGVNIEQISKLLRHSSIKTTESVYAHLMEGKRGEVGSKISSALMERLSGSI